MSIFNYRYWLQVSPKEWVIRFISLGLALVLWYFVGGEDIVNKNVMIPVEVINLPRDLVISNQFKKEIEVSISGPRSQVLDMGNQAISRQVDLAEATPGTMVLENSNDVITVPRGVKVLRIQPESVILSLDKMIQKQFAVKPVTNGTVAQDYILKEIRMEPDSISITGPQTVLAPFEVLNTTLIDITGLNKSTEIQVPLELDPVIVELIGATTITASLVIIEETVQKKISNLPVKVEKDGVLQRVTPAKVSITVALPKTLIRDKVDLQSLFKVTATDEQKDGKMQVKVVPAKTFANTIPILNVEPQNVTLIEEAPQVEPVKDQIDKADKVDKANKVDKAEKAEKAEKADSK